MNMVFPSPYTDKINVNNIHQGEIGMRYLIPANKLMMTGEVTQPSHLPQTSTNLQVEQIRMSYLDKSHRNVSITIKDKFQDQ